MMGEDWLPVLTAELGSDSFFATVNPRKSQLEQDFPTFCSRRSHFQLKWLARNPQQQVWVSRLHRASGFPRLCGFWLYFSNMPVFNLQKYCLDFTQDFMWVSALSGLCSIFWTRFHPLQWHLLSFSGQHLVLPVFRSLLSIRFICVNAGSIFWTAVGLLNSVLWMVQVCPSSDHKAGWGLGCWSWFQTPRFVIILVLAKFNNSSSRFPSIQSKGMR